MPFWLRNAAQSFQRLIDEVWRSVPFTFTYIDDALIASKRMEEHIEYLQLAFERRQHFGLKINAKCIFGTNKLSFLGREIDETEI